MCIYTSQRLVHIVVLRVALIVLKVGERCCLNTDVECPALMVTEGYPCERHLPAVQIARDRYRGHRHLARREVVTRGRSNHRLGRELDAGIEVDGLLQVLLISRSIFLQQLISQIVVRLNLFSSTYSPLKHLSIAFVKCVFILFICHILLLLFPASNNNILGDKSVLKFLIP